MIKIAPRSQRVITMPPKKTMKAIKKATTSKAPKSMKTMKAATAKTKYTAKEAKEAMEAAQRREEDKCTTAMTVESNCQYGFKEKPPAHVKVLFNYGGRKPCTKTADELKTIAATFLGTLRVVASASGARSVSAFYNSDHSF